IVTRRGRCSRKSIIGSRSVLIHQTLRMQGRCWTSSPRKPSGEHARSGHSDQSANSCLWWNLSTFKLLLVPPFPAFPLPVLLDERIIHNEQDCIRSAQDG